MECCMHGKWCVKSRTVMTILGMIDQKHLPSRNRAAAGITPQPWNPDGRPSLPDTCLPCIAPAHYGLLRRRCASCASILHFLLARCRAQLLSSFPRSCIAHAQILCDRHSSVYTAQQRSDSILDLWFLTSYALTDLIITTRVAGFNKAL